MTSHEYLRAHSKKRNNQIVIGPIDEDRPYCPVCFENEEVEKMTFNNDRNGWTCDKGHFSPNEGLARGSVGPGPAW